MLSALNTVSTIAAETSGEQTINPWVVGAISLAILLGLMLALVSFGGGREHS